MLVFKQLFTFLKRAVPLLFIGTTKVSGDFGCDGPQFFNSIIYNYINFCVINVINKNNF